MWGWGHVARECPTAENLDWRGLMRADPSPEKAPGLESTMPNQHVGLHNMSCHTVTLHKGMVIAELSPANAIPKMLAPKLASCQLKFAKNQGPKSNKLEFVDSPNSQPKLTPE